MSTFELQGKVNEIRELRRMAEELDAEITALQDSIKAHMEATSADELTGADFKITWKPITSTRVDTAALKKALEAAKLQAEVLTAEALKASQAEADAVAEAASAKIGEAVQIVIGGLEAKCR